MKRLAIIALGLGLLAGIDAYGQQTGPITGMELNNWCASPDAFFKNVCLTYIGGFGSGFALGQEALALGYRPICPRAGISADQMRLIVQKTMRDHPELLDQDAGVLEMKALVDAFPCKPGETPKYGQKPN